MSQKYSYLKDKNALNEIRKHKWLESEKNGYEVGFATAAFDWIRLYGQPWLAFQDKKNYSEKRAHRRFYHKFPLRLKTASSEITAYTNDISLAGFSCTIPRAIDSSLPAEVTLKLKKPRKLFSPRLKCQFDSKVARISESQKQETTTEYNIFIPFDENMKDFIRANSDFLFN
ncbi:MAG: PilZ domain-containing protein [Candidatus Omnitrophica bacterium]|nr:PilZ domain-containing protein [Candidatus Omnitrophota bacterium]